MLQDRAGVPVSILVGRDPKLRAKPRRDGSGRVLDLREALGPGVGAGEQAALLKVSLTQTPVEV